MQPPKGLEIKIQKNIRHMELFREPYVLENFTGIHAVFVDQKPTHTMKIIANPLM